MKKLLFFLIFLLLATQDPKESLQKDLEKIREKKQQTLQAREAENAKLNEVIKQLNKTEAELNQRKKNLRMLSQKYEMLNIQKNYIHSQLEKILQTQGEQEESFREHVIQIYKEGNLPLVAYLLTSEDPGDFFNRLYYSRWLIAWDSEWLNALKERERKYARLREHYEAVVVRISTLRQEVEKEKTSLEKDFQELNKQKAKHLRQIKFYEETLKEYEEQERALERQLGALAQEKSFANLQFTERLIWPVEGRLSSKFGWRWIRFPGYRKKVKQLHKGIDISAPPGTPIVAAASGYVLQAGWLDLLGNAVVIVHGWREGKQYVTFYGHCDEILVKTGDFVQQGDQIATVGCTGRCLGPHLHFTLHINGNPVDPLPYLSK
ncbi:MAG: murein hydrolase activator EnvC family protein [bacterium JZ-2024 1]